MRTNVELPEHEAFSFAERRVSTKGVRNQRSAITLASSGSSRTIKRMARRYMREQRIVIFEDGAEICEKTPCLVIELNSLLQKYYLQQHGDNKYTTQQQDVNAQIMLYERAVREILDQCGSRLFLKSELSPEDVARLAKLDGAAPKYFNRLYSIYGEEVTSLI